MQMSPITQLEKNRHHFEDLSKKIIGAAIEVHRVLGPGFLKNIRNKKSCQLIFVLSCFRTFVLS